MSADCASVDRSIEAVFRTLSYFIVIFVGDTSITVKVPVSAGISLLYNLVARRSVEDVVIRGSSRQIYCPAVDYSGALHIFRS